MMNELIAEAKNSLGLRAVWLDDEEYEKIITAVVTKFAGYDEDDSRLLAVASSARLNRLLRICKSIKWTDLGVPASKEAATQAALHELATLLLADALEKKFASRTIQRIDENGDVETLAALVDVEVTIGAAPPSTGAYAAVKMQPPAARAITDDMRMQLSLLSDIEVLAAHDFLHDLMVQRHGSKRTMEAILRDQAKVPTLRPGR